MPQYPERHQGTLLVVGSGPTLYDDYERAAAAFPDSWIMAINDVAGVLVANFVVSLEHERMAYFRELQLSLWENFTTHCGLNLLNGQEYYQFPAVDYWWQGAHCPATSAWGGVRIGKMMGFEQIILCGCPLNGGDGYAIDVSQTPQRPGEQRLGHMQGGGLLATYQEMIQLYAQKEGENVYSMSGFTREVLGEPASPRLHKLH